MWDICRIRGYVEQDACVMTTIGEVASNLGGVGVIASCIVLRPFVQPSYSRWHAEEEGVRRALPGDDRVRFGPTGCPVMGVVGLERNKWLLPAGADSYLRRHCTVWFTPMAVSTAAYDPC
jgi:hypothetical protein